MGGNNCRRVRDKGAAESGREQTETGVYLHREEGREVDTGVAQEGGAGGKATPEPERGHE